MVGVSFDPLTVEIHPSALTQSPQHYFFLGNSMEMTSGKSARMRLLPGSSLNPCPSNLHILCEDVIYNESVIEILRLEY